ncbi:hypothetical protein UT300005_02790 [Clostridium sp. CTA-5]
MITSIYCEFIDTSYQIKLIDMIEVQFQFDFILNINISLNIVIIKIINICIDSVFLHIDIEIFEYKGSYYMI